MGHWRLSGGGRVPNQGGDTPPLTRAHAVVHANLWLIFYPSAVVQKTSDVYENIFSRWRTEPISSDIFFMTDGGYSCNHAEWDV